MARSRCRRRCRRARARRRELAGARLRRRVGRDARRTRRRHRAARTIELRLRCRLEHALRDRGTQASRSSRSSLEWTGRDGTKQRRQGEFVVSSYGVEGSLIYAASAELRDAHRGARIDADHARSRARRDDAARLERDLAQPRGNRSLSEHLRRRARIAGVQGRPAARSAVCRRDCAIRKRVAATIKALPLTLLRARPVDEAISSAGGVRFDAIDETLMLKRVPGVFCAGEMLDWEAPTGGYLLTACFASGLSPAAPRRRGGSKRERCFYDPVALVVHGNH